MLKMISEHGQHTIEKKKQNKNNLYDVDQKK